LHKNGLQLKEFDISGNYINQFALPEQMNGYSYFMSKERFLIIARHFLRENEYRNFNVFNLNTEKIEKELVPISRPEISNVYQRFIIKDGIIWTCPGDRLELIGYDLESGKEIKKILINEEFKEYRIKERDAYGGKIRYIYFYNFAQPIMLDNDVFVLVKKQNFKDDSKESLIEPIIKKFTLYQLIDDSLIEVVDLTKYGKMKLANVWRNRLILLARSPYPYIQILEVKKVDTISNF